jgi:hypothetical protein
MTPVRNKDGYQKKVYDFAKNIYVVCPSCTGQALVASPDFYIRNENLAAIRLVCSTCGYHKRYIDTPLRMLLPRTSGKPLVGRVHSIGGAIDPYFQRPLWLSASVGSNLLWAYNYEHLDFLEKFIGANLRERNTHPVSNSNLGSRLPSWMTSAKNRKAVLQAIEKLKKK